MGFPSSNAKHWCCNVYGVRERQRLLRTPEKEVELPPLLLLLSRQSSSTPPPLSLRFFSQERFQDIIFKTQTSENPKDSFHKWNLETAHTPDVVVLKFSRSGSLGDLSPSPNKSTSSQGFFLA